MKKPFSKPDDRPVLLPESVASGAGLPSPAKGIAASPYKSAAEELDGLRKTLREVTQQFARRIDMDIIRLRERVTVAGEEHRRQDNKSRPARGSDAKAVAGDGRLFDLRDMTTLVRTLEVKPAAGRRKDLKKIESLVDDLRGMIERWG